MATVNWLVIHVSPVKLWSPVFYSAATTTTILQLSGLCLGQPGWAGTRRNIHPLTPVMVINRCLSASSIFYNPWHPPCSIYMPDSVFPQSLSQFSLSTSWPGTLHLILHTPFHCPSFAIPSVNKMIKVKLKIYLGILSDIGIAILRFIPGY